MGQTGRHDVAVWRRLTSQGNNRLEVRFRTESENGVLLIQNKGPHARSDYLAMAVVDGRVEASYNLGSQGSRNLFFLRSSPLVNDGHWHVAVLDR